MVTKSYRRDTTRSLEKPDGVLAGRPRKDLAPLRRSVPSIPSRAPLYRWFPDGDLNVLRTPWTGMSTPAAASAPP